MRERPSLNPVSAVCHGEENHQQQRFLHTWGRIICFVILVIFCTDRTLSLIVIFSLQSRHDLCLSIQPRQGYLLLLNCTQDYFLFDYTWSSYNNKLRVLRCKNVENTRFLKFSASEIRLIALFSLHNCNRQYLYFVSL